MPHDSLEPHNSTIYIAGHTGLIGSALMRRFARHDGVRVLTADRAEVDLTDSRQVRQFLERERPDVVIIAAGNVAGILANMTMPATILYENLMIETNLIHAAWRARVTRLLYFGSTCMYPRLCPQPMRPDRLMAGEIEPTSEPTAAAKWAGLTLCAAYRRQYGVNFISTIPCTVYGPGGSFDPETSHVTHALIRKFHFAAASGRPSLTLWGSGAARREFLYVEDLAEASERLLRVYDAAEPVNIGVGRSHSIRELASIVADVVGFRGEICWDPTRPDGAPEKLLDSAPLRQLGWTPRTDLRTGLAQTYRWFLEHETASVTFDPSCASS